MSRAAVKRLRPVTSNRRAKAPDPTTLELLAEIKRLTLALEDKSRGPAPMTLDEWIPRWKQRVWPHTGAATHTAYNTALKTMVSPHLGKLQLAAIDDVTITTWQAALKGEGYAVSTIAHGSKVLRNMLRRAVKDKVLVSAPEMRIDRGRKEQPWLREADFERVVRAAEAHSDRTLVLVLLGGDAGLRRGEAIGLRFSHIEDGVIGLRQQRGLHGLGPPKNNGVRLIPMTPRLAAVVARLRAQLPDGVEDGYVVLNHKGAPLSYHSVPNVMRRVAKLAGLKRRLKFHSKRHTFISHLGGKNAALPVIQRLVGHANMATTQLYMHTEDEQLHLAIEALRR